MGNTFSPPTSGSGLIPSPDAVVSGQIIQANTISRLANMVNYTHAQLGCSPVVSQGWPDGVFAVTGTPAAPNARWRIPIPSNAHQTLLIHVQADNSSNAGSITLEELTNNNTSTAKLIHDERRKSLLNCCFSLSKRDGLQKRKLINEIPRVMATPIKVNNTISAHGLGTT